jgi:hypothetical protein
LLNNPYAIAIGIPVILLLSGALAKKLVRGSDWERFDFFLGVEFTLAAMSSALIYVFDLVKLGSQPNVGISSLMSKFAATATFIAVTFFFLLWVLSLHQDWTKRNDNPRGQTIRLGIIANLVGAGLLAAFVLLVKGVQ